MTVGNAVKYFHLNDRNRSEQGSEAELMGSPGILTKRSKDEH